ncbi:tRNA (guanosine(37)-N1)-methyltransferase TrmD [bacterium]|nr:tRNA (guanosine(37)-N1)-methyltransferase TrmD [bacterium]MBU1982783.1 tRNA (guanosine(37)-N1)-methyltransferase TrmD [bacterium]
MTIDILTGFPEIFSGLVNHSILRNALLSDAVEIWVHNLRYYTNDRHGSIDDAPYGGSAGMVLMAQPIWAALDSLRKLRNREATLLCMSAQGMPLTQSKVRELSGEEWLIVLCGHYKDVDARVFERDPWIELSVGDYVLSGGEIPAAILVDAVTRLLPGVMTDPQSAATDSFEDGLLDAPHYTRPDEIDGLRVPETLLSGHHEQIEKWHVRQRVERTRARRPDLWETWAKAHPEYRDD